jgi:F-type H+-transporting ATPase subunit b
MIGTMVNRAMLAASFLGVALFAAPAFAQHDGLGHAEPAEHGDVQDTAQGAPAGAEADGEHAEGHGAGHGSAHGGAHGAAHGGHHDPSLDFNFVDGIGPNVVSMPWKHQDSAGGPLGDGKQGEQPLAAGQAETPRNAPFALLVFNFGILLLILWKWGAPAARNAAETRSDQIKTALDEAARLRDQAKAKLEEYGAKLKAAQTEIDDMVAGMRRDAEADKQRILANAETQAKALQRDAEDRIAAEIGRARAELQREVTAAALAVAEKLLRERATPADQSTLVDGFINEISAAASRGGRKEA